MPSGLLSTLTATPLLADATSEPYYAYFRSARYAAQYEEYGPTYELGIKANF